MANISSVNARVGHAPKKSRQTDRKMFQSQLDKLTGNIQAVEEKIKSLNLKIPDKKSFTDVKNDLYQNLDHVKQRRTQQFHEKRVVDADLKAVNNMITTKFDMIGKLKSSLRYKTPERVDEILVKLEKQLSKPDMKSSEQRRLQAQITELRSSKERILELREMEFEVHSLKQRQSDLRKNRDENVRLIKLIKQEEATTVSALTKHKKAEDEAWTVYKENCSIRDNLQREKDALMREKRELSEKFRKEKDAKLFRNHETSFPKQESNERSKEHNIHRMITVKEKKKIFDDEIRECNVLLSYLEKYNPQRSTNASDDQLNAQDSSTVDKDGESNDKQTVDDIYRGVRRRRSRRERRRKHATTELKKMELHVTVLEKFSKLGVHPPSNLAEIQNAIDALLEKKEYFQQEQVRAPENMDMRRASSIPTLGFKSSTSELRDNTTESSVNELSNAHLGKKLSRLEIQARHKSCPSLFSDLERKHADLPLPSSSSGEARDFSASNSEYDLDSPVSGISSVSFGDARENPIDQAIDDYSRLSKLSHKVHFSNDFAMQNTALVASNSGHMLPAFASLIMDTIDNEQNQRQIGDSNAHHKRIQIIDVDDGEEVADAPTFGSCDNEQADGMKFMQMHVLGGQLPLKTTTEDHVNETVKRKEDDPLGKEHRLNHDAFLQFDMDVELSRDCQREQPSNVHRDKLAKTDNHDSVPNENHVNDVRPKNPRRRSSSCCSPRSRRSGPEFLSLNQNADDIVQVIT